jgi:hypothetical protein
LELNLKGLSYNDRSGLLLQEGACIATWKIEKGYIDLTGNIDEETKKQLGPIAKVC